MKNAAKRGIIGSIGLLFAFSAIFAAVFCVPNGVAQAADSSEGWADGTFTALNTGIYWYQSGSEVPLKAGTEGAVFDSEKPTVIFAHGLKSEEGYNRRDVLTLWGNTEEYFDDEGFGEFEFDKNFYQYYIDTGYNVGHFYWSQLSDDELNCDIKIWSSNTELGMRYFVSDTNGNRVQGDTALNPTKSVAMIFGDEITRALGENYSKSIQLIGHSMGGQLVLATSEYLVESCKAGKIGRNLVPERTTLLDPYFGMSELKNCKIDHLGINCEQVFTARLSANAMENIADFGIAVDAYSANDVFICRLYKFMLGKERKDEADAITKSLTDNCAWVHLNAMQDLYTMLNTHCMVVDYYFSTLFEEAKTDNTGNPVPYALSDCDTLKSLRGCGYKQVAANEENPFYMHNSNFERVDSEINVIETENGNSAIIYGVLENNNLVNSVKLFDNNGNFVATSKVSSANEYHFYNLNSGKYTLKAYSLLGNEVILENNVVEVNENQILTASIKSTNIEIFPQNNLTWLWILLGVLGALLLSAAVIFVLIKKRKSARGNEAVKYDISDINDINATLENSEEKAENDAEN